MFDTHTHIFDKKLINSIEEILKNLKALNFKGILCICENDFEADMFLKFYKDYEFLYCAAGIHPHNAENFNEKDLKNLINKLLHTGRLVALGETGLDFYYNLSNREKQIKVFLKHIEIAKEYSLPLIIHSRNSNEILYKILTRQKISKGVLHCFSGDKKLAKDIIKLGLYIGVTGIVTFKNSKNIKEVVESVPLEKIVIETDSPYLSPEPLRGKINTPLNLLYILKKIAEIKNLDLKYLEEKLDSNSLELFNIKNGGQYE